MPSYEARLERRRDLTDTAAAFVLSRPSGFTFEAGQSISLTLIDPVETDAKGASRTFSLVSAPHEPFLEVATRLRTSAFKRVLASLPKGSALRIRGPGGQFTLPQGERPLVFHAGGIGITPFVSMLRAAAAPPAAARDITLLYANRRPDDIAYAEELQGLRRRLQRFNLVTLATIDEAAIDAHAPQAASAVHFIAGAPSMVSGLRTLLLQRGVDAQHVRVDEFFGY